MTPSAKHESPTADAAVAMLTVFPGGRL